MQRVLLDTCALIWLAAGDKRLSQSARETIQDSDFLCFSSISIWEIARKVKKRELEIPVTPTKFADMLVKQYGMKELPLDNTIMLRASRCRKSIKMLPTVSSSLRQCSTAVWS